MKLFDGQPQAALRKREYDYQIPEAVAEALENIGQAAVEALIAALRSKSHGEYTRRQIASILGKIGDPRAVEVLAACLNESDVWLRGAALESLVGIGTPAVEALKAVMDGKDEEVRQDIAETQHRIAAKKEDKGEAELNMKFIYAASSNHIEDMKRFLAAGANVNFQFPDTGRTALHIAANELYVDCAKILLASGADVRIKSSDEDRTPLHELAWGKQRDAQKEKEIGDLLLAAGADVNAENCIGASPLVYAITYERPWLVKLFLQAGAETALKNLKIDKTFAEFAAAASWSDKKAKAEMLAILEEKLKK